MPSKPAEIPADPTSASSKAAVRASAKILTKWQPPALEPKPDKSNGKGAGCKLADFDPAAKPFSSGDKQRDIAATEALAMALDALQNLFYADRRFKMLVILQGTDTSGKDGTDRKSVV